MDYSRYKELAECALGVREASLVFANARIVNVLTGEIIRGDIAVEDGVIVGVGAYTGPNMVDLGGRYVCPGFIDAHLHLESTLAAPRELIHAALAQGTTTFIVDPHEVANVAGEAGIDYIIDQTGNLPAHVFVMLPSCVPVNRDEENGCDLTAARMRPYLDNPRVLGLGEVMDAAAVVRADPAMLEKLTLFEGRIKDGHAPGLSDKQMAAYALAGIRTDHECTDYDYAMKELRAGLYVLIREGSGARNLEAIVSGIVANGIDTTRFAFCTDDKHISDIQREGHISHNVREGIRLGLSPMRAIQMATINPATCYGLEGLGAVAPGYRADLVVLDDLDTLAIHSVYCGGEPVGDTLPGEAAPCPPGLLQSVRVPDIGPEDIALPLADALTDVIGMMPGQITTRHLREAVPVSGGLFAPDAEYSKVVVVERHKGTGHIGVAVAKGFHIRGGAMGTTLSHDAHNMVVVGDNDASILAAIRELTRAQGGYTLIQGEAVAATLPLPILGLMTQADNDQVERTLQTLYAKARQMGVPQGLDPYVTLSFIALPVIPSLRVTTRGLYDVEKQAFV